MVSGLASSIRSATESTTFDFAAHDVSKLIVDDLYICFAFITHILCYVLCKTIQICLLLCKLHWYIYCLQHCNNIHCISKIWCLNYKKIFNIYTSISPFIYCNKHNQHNIMYIGQCNQNNNQGCLLWTIYNIIHDKNYLSIMMNEEKIMIPWMPILHVIC